MKKATPKKAVKKAVKKVAPKKVAKKVATKKVVKKDPTAKQLMKAFTSILKMARKKKKTEVIVLTTKRKDYNDEFAHEQGYGAEDLKPNLKEFYKMLLCEHDASTRPVNIENHQIAWVVKIK